VATRQPGQWDSKSQQSQEIFLFFEMFRPALGPTQPPVPWVSGTLLTQGQHPEHEVEHSLWCWGSECTKLHVYSPTDLNGVQRDNFAVTLHVWHSSRNSKWPKTSIRLVFTSTRNMQLPGLSHMLLYFISGLSVMPHDSSHIVTIQKVVSGYQTPPLLKIASFPNLPHSFSLYINVTCFPLNN
jgi:hypothetical protein